MKPLYYLFLVSILLIGCQDRLSYQTEDFDEAPITKAEEMSRSFSINEPYTFVTEKDFKAWTDIVTLEGRLAACEIPESTLKAMTTDALVRTVLKYPLNFIYSAYNDPFVAVDIIVKNSPLHQELFSRNDAAEMLLHYFGRTCIDKSLQETSFNRDESCLTYANELFFEYLLSSRLSTGLFSKHDLLELQSTARRKFEERQIDSKDFSEVSLAPLRLMLEGTSSSSQTRSFYYWQWYTPFGHMFRAEARTEMTDMEIYTITSDYVSNYPDAGMVALASDRYNGNGYAWMINDPTAGSNNSATTSNSWLYDEGGLGNSGNNITYMWGNDLYTETTISSEAEKIYYNGADHSALPYYNQRYISKWGNGPLVSHAPTYCPYLTTDMKYYKIRTEPTSGNFVIVGDTQVVVDEANVYSFPASLRGITLNWSVENISTGSTSSFSFSPTTHTLCCYEPGAYVIHVDGYFGSNHVITRQKIIVCSPY